MGVLQVGEIVALMLSPSLIVATVLYLPRTIRAVRRLVTQRGTDPTLQPMHPPIEQVAAELRRLLQRHETLRRSTDVAMRDRHLWVLEGAIAHCATEAARTLELPCPEGPAYSTLPRTELRRLLHSLVAAGLVLPPAIGLLAADDGA